MDPLSALVLAALSATAATVALRLKWYVSPVSASVASPIVSGGTG